MTRICIIKTIEGYLGDNAIYDLENYQNEFKMHADYNVCYCARKEEGIL